MNNKEKAKSLYLESGGTWGPKKIAEEVGNKCKPSDVSRWKFKEKWADEVDGGKTRRQGGQEGNDNAKGNHTPHGSEPYKGNQNAVRSGAWASPRVKKLPAKQRKMIKKLCDDVRPHGDRYAYQLEMYLAKQADLEIRIASIDAPEDDETTFLDKTTTIDRDGQQMEYFNKDTKASRRAKLEQELNRVQGRISRFYENIRALEEADRRHALAREQFEFQKAKALGEFTVDEAGEMVLEPQEDEDEIIEE